MRLRVRVLTLYALSLTEEHNAVAYALTLYALSHTALTLSGLSL
jgi:hypothetical protein